MISFCDIFFVTLRRFAFIRLSRDLVEYTWSWREGEISPKSFEKK